MNEVFSAHLRELRANRDKSQKDMAQEIGISAAALSSYEKGQKTPPLDIAEKIARTYGVSLDWLCGISSSDTVKGEMKYSDAIKMMVKLEKEGVLSPEYVLLPHDAGNRGAYALVPSQGRMDSFVTKWESINRSFASDVIDMELYQAWIEKQIRDNDKPILHDIDGSIF